MKDKQAESFIKEYKDLCKRYKMAIDIHVEPGLVDITVWDMASDNYGQSIESVKAVDFDGMLQVQNHCEK